MTDSKRIFLDTSPLIYYLQPNDLYYSIMKSFWGKYSEWDYITSAFTVTEYLTYPFQKGDSKMVQDFYSFLWDMHIRIKNINREIAEKAAKIRAEYKGFKAMDSLQLATACLTV